MNFPRRMLAWGRCLERRGWCAPFVPSKAVCTSCAALRGWRVCCLLWRVWYLVECERCANVSRQVCRMPISQEGMGAPPGPCVSWLVFIFLVSKASCCGGPGESRRGVLRGECYTVLPPNFRSWECIRVWARVLRGWYALFNLCKSMLNWPW